jgi:hypothetical protein
MPVKHLVRTLVPGYLAGRARQHEQTLRKRQGISALAERLDPVVASGPFSGLQYPAELLDEVDVPVAKLLGVYEQELAPVFYKAIEDGTRTFIDVGCADGYFAVGLPRSSAAITSHAFDIARSARAVCNRRAVINGVASRVQVKKRFNRLSLTNIHLDQALMLCDIEGGERELFDGPLVRLLAGVLVVVEVHEFAMPGTQAYLDRIFASSHHSKVIPQQARFDPSSPKIAGWTSLEQSKALSENRPSEMWWACFTPR